MAALECALCGRFTEKLTKEHLPQKGLYSKETRKIIPNLHTLKACESCNNGSSEQDEIFKVFIGLVAQQDGNELLYSVSKTFDNNGKLKRSFIHNLQIEERNGQKVRLWNAREHTQIVLDSAEKCAKGLYFREFGEVLIKSKSISFVPTPFVYEKDKVEVENRLKDAKWFSVNGQTVNYTFLDMKNTDTLIIINFFSSAEFVFCIRDKEYSKKVHAGLISLSQ
ncbi:hypothetical protein QL995_02415 [Pseudoalteromonas sp. APC 3358]|uniref:hypothetical protein n=1 Tax=Pseudoalteromonas sp. APC 3358 TaxID=3035176 RepID=UPI0025B5B56C|nr:hypothetical protein [Pseudoalteromonas sp. APC 3358]MDN3381534.1 hypothetical protein [Pseudoalteromonas sp. APC 3358]